MSSKQIIQEAERDGARSVSISRFLSAMPWPLSNHVFKYIIDEGIRVGSVLPEHETRNQLINSIGKYYNHTKTGPNIDLLCKFTGVPQETLFGDILFFDIDKVTNRIHDSCNIESLDDIRKLSLCSECFSIDDATTLKDRICQKLLYVNDCEKTRRGISTDVAEYLLPSMRTDKAENIFEKLGYQTLLESWANTDDTDPYTDFLFYEWYCKGKIIDTVLDCIFAYEIPYVSRKMLAYLKDECKLDANLTEAVNERINSLRELDIRIPELKIDGAAQVQTEHGDYIPALPEIIELNNNGEFAAISQTQLSNLFKELANAGYLSHISWSQFLTAFSGRGRYVKERMEWQDSQQTLAMFLYYANGGRTSDGYCRMAMELFCRRNNGKCSLETLTRIYPEKNNEVWECFQKAGINIKPWEKREK